MNTRTADLVLLRQVKKKLVEIESNSNAISNKQEKLKRLREDSKTPGYYQKLSTDNVTSIKFDIQKQCTSEKSKIERFIYIVSLVLNLCMFAFTIVWLICAPKDAWIHQADDGDTTLFWIGHCILGLFVSILPVMAYLISKEAN